MKRWMSNSLIVIFMLVFLVSAFFLGKYFWESRQQKGQYDQLAQIVEQAKQEKPQKDPIKETKPADPSDPAAPTQESTEPESELVLVIDPATGASAYVLPEYAQLYLMNTDLVGWITIDGTTVNYPVMQTPDRVDYYLYRDFFRKDSKHGCIYVREQCDVYNSDNVVIYGHRMKDGSMFNNLLLYKERDYYEDRRYIQFNTLTERHTYEIVAVFTTVATESGFGYHLFNDAANQEEFDAFIAQCKALSLYDTGVDAQYGDKLITLSTCEYSRDNGRMVLVAKQIS